MENNSHYDCRVQRSHDVFHNWWWFPCCNTDQHQHHIFDVWIENVLIWFAMWLLSDSNWTNLIRCSWQKGSMRKTLCGDSCRGCYETIYYEIISNFEMSLKTNLVTNFHKMGVTCDRPNITECIKQTASRQPASMLPQTLIQKSAFQIYGNAGDDRILVYHVDSYNMTPVTIGIPEERDNDGDIFVVYQLG